MTTKADAARFLERAQSDPVWFVRHVLGGYPWSKQRQILESVRDRNRTAVRSGHGTGKTKVASWAALWFLFSHPNSRVITTAPTWAQVKELLWREIRTAHAAAKVPLGGKPNQTDLDLGDGWFALGLSTNEPERFQGHHAEHLLLIADEASGVDQRIFEAAEGFMTGPHARMLLIGNPTVNSGQFFDAFHKERQLWSLIHMDVEQSPNMSGEQVPADVALHLPSRSWVEDKRIKWGEGSIPWAVRVKGQFSELADDTVMSLAAVEAAQQLRVDPSAPRVLGCDVARFGVDSTIIAYRQGLHVRILDAYVGKDTVYTAGRLAHWYTELTPDRIVIDDVGVGGGVTDGVRNQNIPGVVAYNGGAAAKRPRKYPNRRCELWFEFAEALAEWDKDAQHWVARMDLPPDDEQLAADLVAPVFKMDPQGRRVVEAKAETKKRLLRSPDRADAVLLTFASEKATGGFRAGGGNRSMRGRL